MIGAAAGAGLAAGLGPKEEPMWKKLLVGGSLGAVAGLGAGAAMGAGAAGAGGAGAAAAGTTTATTAGTTTGAVAGGVGGTTAGTTGGLAAGATTASTVPTVGSGGLAGGIAGGATPVAATVPATTAGGLTAPMLTPSMTVPMGTMAPLATPMSSIAAAPAGAGFMGTVNGGLGAVGNMVANNPLVFGATGLGAAGALLPGGEHEGGIKSSKGYDGEASWEGSGSSGGSGGGSSWDATTYDQDYRKYPSPRGGLGVGRYYFR